MKPKRRVPPENLRRYQLQIEQLSENAASSSKDEQPADDARFSVKKPVCIRKRDRKLKRNLKKAKKHAFYTKQSLEAMIEKGEVKGIRQRPPKRPAKERAEKQEAKQTKKKEKERETQEKEKKEKQRRARVEGLKEENKVEDRMIKKYEKLLGMKKKRNKYQAGFYNDGFDQLLDFCDEEKREKIVEDESKSYGENVWLNDGVEEESQDEDEEGEGSQEGEDDMSASDGEAVEEIDEEKAEVDEQEEEHDGDDGDDDVEEEEEDDDDENEEMSSDEEEEEMEASGGDNSEEDDEEEDPLETETTRDYDMRALVP